MNIYRILKKVNAINRIYIYVNWECYYQLSRYQLSLIIFIKLRLYHLSINDFDTYYLLIKIIYIILKKSNKNIIWIARLKTL